MAVAFDAKNEAQTTVGVASLDVTLTVGSGANRALVASITFGQTATPAGLTLTWDNGGTNQAMTAITGASIADGGSSDNIQFYGLIAPTSGSNLTLHAAWTGSIQAILCAASWTGVNQTGGSTSFPHGTSNTGTGTLTTSVTITSATGNAIMGAGSSFGRNFTAGMSDSQLAVGFVTGAHGSGFNWAAGSGTPHALTGTMNATNNWCAAGTDILAGPVASATETMMPMISM